MGVPVMALKIWLARNNDTLRIIADYKRVSIDDLITLNPSIKSPDQIIAGKPVIFLSSSNRK
jgi:hypothetical protein